MLIPTAKQKGVSLVELVIGLVILTILLAAGLPSFALWTQNTQNRTAAESVLSGLQLARNEALRRNVNVRFDLTDASGLISWNVGCVFVTASCPATIQSRASNEGTSNARAGAGIGVAATPFSTVIAAGAGLPAGVTFTGLGRVDSANILSDLTRIDITNAVATGARRMVVTVGTGGATRMCDPALSLASNPQGCS